MNRALLLSLFFISFICRSQTTVYGIVIDEYDIPIPLTNISIEGGNVGTVTDFDGMFTLTVDKELPFSITASSIGYESQTIEITSVTDFVTIKLSEGTELDIVVVSASRAPERIFESPVSVEYFGARDIKKNTSLDFYSGLESLKGVDVNTGSLLFNSVNTRGYGSFSNPRFVQLIDGADNSLPALGYAVGNLVGISDLDVSNVELLPGASSALYGANAFNGILFINSKNPFENQGISAYVKGGATSQEAAGTNLFYDFGIRAAKAFSNKFAAKVNMSFFKGTDWWATNFDNINNPGLNSEEDPNYDGFNIYGDEIERNMTAVGSVLLARQVITPEQFALLPEGQDVSRTGYAEQDLVDYDTESFKFSGSLHYRPFADDFEIIFNSRLGRGNSIIQNTNRFSAPNFFLQQHRLEIKNNNFFVRGYINSQNAGDLYDTRIAAININQGRKTDNEWFGEYVTTYANARSAGLPNNEAHSRARAIADANRLIPGTAEFQEALDNVTSDTDFTTGSKFKDESNYSHVDVNYNFSHLTGDIADIQIGGSLRTYNLKSFGSVFTDANNDINYSEYGTYLQIQKEAFDDRLKFTGSIRYDKSELFDGNFSPRLSVVYTLGENKNHNIRASLQSGFRNPTAQNVYMGLDVARAITVGTAKDNPERDIRTYSYIDRATNMPTSVTLSGQDVLDNSYSLTSVSSFAESNDITNLEKSNVKDVRPEEVTAYEIGYRGKYGNSVTFSLAAYYNSYENFINSTNVITPFYGTVADGNQTLNDPNALLALSALQNGDFQVYNFATNTEQEVRSYGVTTGINARIFNNYDFGINYAYAKEDIDGLDAGSFNTEFNSPEHRVKATFGNTNIIQNLGFNTSIKWNSEFLYNDAFGSIDVPSFTIIDAQVNYTIPFLKSTLKVGGTNLTGKEYFDGIATGFIGSLYYIGLTINNL
ncbi:TonB-dependent receptor [Aquimarina sp. ERC-38]|uniref:TonB-dependent receptor n=1 Tax=Aquimarina sp. ERC-38 TaxID=2949996 RepID=UPI002246BBFC|nr:TonB-dependent receptor [Aquimarina sp. ERC-38]UZO82164.1 TonB-dependent receptor [Aquimarina sp. ERC-38]